MLEVSIPMKVTLSLENSYYFFFFCDQREEIYRERALFLKCPQT